MKKSLTGIALSATVLLGACAAVEQGVYDWGVKLMRARSHMQYRTLSTSEPPIAYLERPGRSHPLVLVHGYTSNKDAWLRFAAQMPAGYRIIAPDLPGHGDNVRDEDLTYDIGHLADGLAAVVDGLALERFHLVGSSLGGAVAIVYGLRHPERIASLGLFATAGFESPQPSDFEKAVARGDNPLVVSSKADFDRFVDLCFHDPPWMPWPVASVMIREDRTHGPFYRKMLADVMASPRLAADTVGRLQMPVFVLWGDKDRVLHVSTTGVIQRQLPHARTVIMKDCGHIPMMERPAETARHYLSFLTGLDASKTFGWYLSVSRYRSSALFSGQRPADSLTGPLFFRH